MPSSLLMVVQNSINGLSAVVPLGMILPGCFKLAN